MPTPTLFSRVPPFPPSTPHAPLPTVSFSQLQQHALPATSTVFSACRALGFFLLDFRGSAEGEELLKKAERMFEITEEVNGMEHEELMKYHAKPPKDLHGYKTYGITKNELGNPDRLTFYTILQDDMLGNAPRRANPSPIDSNRAAITSYIRSAYAVCLLIFSALETHLHLPPNTFSSLQPPSQRSGTSVRLLRYPPQPLDDRQTSLVGHTDIGSVTLLFNVTGGLQILPPDPHLDPTDPNAWAYVRPQPGCAIVNIGDAMVEWSGGVLRSNMHRVTWAPGEQAHVMRYSVAYLLRAAGEAPMKRLTNAAAAAGAEDAVEKEDEQKKKKCLIPDLAEGEQDSQLVAREWEEQSTIAIQAGKVSARSKGGKKLDLGNSESESEVARMAGRVIDAVGA